MGRPIYGAISEIAASQRAGGWTTDCSPKMDVPFDRAVFMRDLRGLDACRSATEGNVYAGRQMVRLQAFFVLPRAA